MTGSRCQAIDTALKTLRAGCTTCRDAFLAPDAQTLARQVQGIIDQGAQDGEFAAAQSITENVFEYVDRAGATFDARSPSTRYGAITPTRFITSFSLPGFKGQLRAYQNDGAGNAVLKWSAADKLNALVRQNFLNGTCKAGNEALVNECLFADLHGGVASDPATSAAVIKRRIYSTERNGLFDFSAASLIAGTANQRVSLWPPSTAAIVPADYATQGTLDVALGLPPDSTPALQAATEFATLQARFKACSGANPSSTPTNLPAACTNADPLVRMKAARREARELILAFAAGARPVLATGGLKRSGTSGSAAGRNQILYTYRDSVLADSELATLAVVTPPLPSEPLATPYIPEYKLFRDGARDASARNPDTAGAQIKQGFGLRSPDDDGTAAADENDTRTALKPVMTVVYAPANDMLHAFRAGPSTSPSSLCDAYATTLSSAYDCGGEELWGFVPYDQLATLGLLAANQPQGRDNHVYMLARGARFSDVFVPQALTGVSVGGVTQPTMKGVWRRVLYFGRGIGGKHVTALDVTAPGTYTAGRLQTAGPLPLWSRGNPDTRDGLATGTPNGSGADLTAYATMGQTWSVPVVAYVGGLPFYVSARASGRAGCASGSGCAVDHVLFMGSGYSETAGQGTTLYTLDALTGDVIASLTREQATSLVAEWIQKDPALLGDIEARYERIKDVGRRILGRKGK